MATFQNNEQPISHSEIIISESSYPKRRCSKTQGDFESFRYTNWIHVSDSTNWFLMRNQLEGTVLIIV